MTLRLDNTPDYQQPRNMINRRRQPVPSAPPGQVPRPPAPGTGPRPIPRPPTFPGIPDGPDGTLGPDGTFRPTAPTPSPGDGTGPILRPPFGATTGSGARAGRPQQPGVTPFGFASITPLGTAPGSNLRGTQIAPTTGTGYDRMVGQSAQRLSDFSFSPYRELDAPTFDDERGRLDAADRQMSGLALDFGGANAQYGGAQQTLADAQAQASGILRGAAGRSFGGGTARADTGRLNADLDGAASFVGPQFAAAGDLANPRAQTLAALTRAMEGPDRMALASQAFDLTAERSQSDFDRNLRTVGQRAAALGRIGSGMTTNDLTDVQARRSSDLNRTRRELALSAAGETLADRIAQTQLGLGVTSGFGSEDRANVDTRLRQGDLSRSIASDRFAGERLNAELADSGMERQQRGAIASAENDRAIGRDLFDMGDRRARLGLDIGDRFSDQTRDRTALGERQAGFTRNTANDRAGFTRDTFAGRQQERDSARRDEFDRFDAEGRRFDTLEGAQGRERNFQGSLRDELRGERGYQDALARQAIEDEYRRMGFEEDLRDRRFRRASGTLGAGSGYDPTSAYTAAGNREQGNANAGIDAVGEFMRNWFASRNRGPTTTGGR